MELLDSGDTDLVRLGLDHLAAALIIDWRYRSDSQPALDFLQSHLSPENFQKVMEHERRLTARLANSGELENIGDFLIIAIVTSASFSV